jgi:hypothetical protein
VSTYQGLTYDLVQSVTERICKLPMHFAACVKLPAYESFLGLVLTVVLALFLSLISALQKRCGCNVVATLWTFRNFFHNALAILRALWERCGSVVQHPPGDRCGGFEPCTPPWLSVVEKTLWNTRDFRLHRSTTLASATTFNGAELRLQLWSHPLSVSQHPSDPSWPWVHR